MALTQITDPGVKDDAIKAKHIATDAVDSPEIAANAVGASELADNAVDTNAIQDNAVTPDQIAENAVGNSELATNAVATGNVQDNAITAPKTDLTMAQGSLVVGTGADTWGTLAKGTAGQVLTMNSGATTAEWATGSSTDSTKMPLAGGTFTGDVIFEGSGADRELKWDKSENILSLKYPGGTGRLEIGNNLKLKSDSATDSRIHLDNNATAALLSYEAEKHQFVPNTGTSDYKIAQFDPAKGAVSGDCRLYSYVANASSSVERLRTTSAGITVTGTTTTTGLVSGGLTYPASDGSANQVLKTDGSGALGWTTVAAGGKFVSYAAICDKKAYDADGGTFSDGAWRTRNLNHEIRDEDSIVSISSDQFTLVAGDYLIRWTAPAENVNRNTSRLYNVTDSTVVGTGTTIFLSNGISTEVTGSSTGTAYVSISAAKAFEIQHYGQTSRSTTGFGMKSNLSGVDSIYTIVEIFKES